MGQPSIARIDSYDNRDLIRLRATFVSTDLSTPADASSIFAMVQNPYGTVATYAFSSGSIVRSGVGGYWLELTPSMAGNWYYRWEASGGVQAAEEWSFIVSQSKFQL